ncbi:phospholipase B1, membrane-associated-like [Diadema antillarum]|uniref:phospholipase B1, membrane-associated-like n=1 Tax=Diadema antillarum TaxID=105358 RepID=UPI003A8613DB
MAMLRVFTFLALFLVPTRGGVEENFRELFEAYSENYQAVIQTSADSGLGDDDEYGISFNCQPSVSPEKPTSVHRLRPGDIDVVAAIGDSLSTAYAAEALIFLPVMLNYWGVSASIGGNDDISSVGTVANILRQYNPDIFGFSTGSGVVFTQPKVKNFNHAVVGATADDMPKQARRLIDDLKADSRVDMENDWKFITLFIGGNDLCSGCNRENSKPAAFLGFVQEALQMFHDEVPRTFVNLVGVMNAYVLPELGGSLTCNLVHRIVCKCLSQDGGDEEVYQRTKEYQKMVQEFIESGYFDNKEDFTVAYQPFFHETTLPRKPDGKPDASYFAPDCFHFSQKGQTAQAVANWNSLFEPVGSKRLEWVPGEELQCPSEVFPYIYTNVNSQVHIGESDQQEMPSHQETAGHIPLSSKSGFTSQTLIIVGAVSGVLVSIVVIAIFVSAWKKPRKPNTTYATF